MKSWTKKILWVLLVIVVTFFIYKLIQKEKTYEHFNVIELNKDNYIKNRTDIDYLDTIIHVGLSKLNIKNVYVIIYPLTENTQIMFSNDLKLEAHIRGTNHQYIIWIRDLSRSRNISVLSHELIHLYQYETKKLVYVDDTVIWNGDRVKLDNLNYGDRPWEIEAFYKEGGLENLIREELYK